LRQEKERAEQQRILEEKNRAEGEKRFLQQKLFEAEKNKSVVLSGFVSTQSSESPVSLTQTIKFAFY
jgi:hypothetical protein